MFVQKWRWLVEEKQVSWFDHVQKEKAILGALKNFTGEKAVQGPVLLEQPFSFVTVS